MENDNDWIKKIIKEVVAKMLTFIAALVIVACLVTFCGCKEMQYIPVETIKTEYKHITDTVHHTNSVIDRQTTVIREVDSAMMAQFGIQLKAAERAWLIQNDRLQREIERLKEAHTDTVFKTDSIQVPVPVERKLTKWEKVCLDYGKLMMGGTVCAVLMGVGYAVLWIRRRRMK